MNNNITIERLFNLQERCSIKNKELVTEKSAFVEECIELICNRVIINEGFTEIEKSKFKVMHQFLDTALSSLINSYKMLLYGCPGDSLSLLRISFEATVFQDYAVVFEDYERVKNEVILNKRKQGVLTFEKALGKLEKKERTTRGKLFGLLSALGSHLTSNRMHYNYFMIKGKTYPITSHAILDKAILEEVISIQMQIALYMVNVLSDFYRKNKPEAVDREFFSQSDLLKKKYDKYIISIG
ncbi:MAG: hypothetical protein WC486_00385 [Candidatus Omnitrophota bacterium]